MDLSNIYNIQKNYFLRGNTLSVSFRKQQLKKLYEAINRYENCGCFKERFRQKQGRKLYE